MQPQDIVEIAHHALVLVLILSLPAVVTAAVVGLLAGVVQAVTSIQDQSIPQSLKLIAVLAVVLLTSKWMAGQIFAFAEKAMSSFAVLFS
jgi:type III secretion protein S